jgi:hypothetical protein
MDRIKNLTFTPKPLESFSRGKILASLLLYDF